MLIKKTSFKSLFFYILLNMKGYKKACFYMLKNLIFERNLKKCQLIITAKGKRKTL